MKHGIDVSHHQGEVNKDVLANNPPDFMITRSSYVGSETNEFTVDGRFNQNAPLLKGVAVRGVYHYYSSEKNWSYQADHFIDLVKDHDFDFFAVDMEKYYNNPDEAYALGAVEFFKKAKQALGIPGLIYTAKYYYQDNLKKYTEEYDKLPLWIASPMSAPSMPVSRGSDDWVIWQYSASGDACEYGFEGDDNGYIDVNRMKDAFYEKVKSTTDTSPNGTPKTIVNQYIQALNSHSPDQVVNLYAPIAAHITPKRTIKGKNALRTWYSSFFNKLPDATFQLKECRKTGSSWHITWTAQSPNMVVENGKDTIAMLGGKIIYHVTRYTPVPVQDDERPTGDPPWLAIARQEMGVHEFDGDPDNPRIVEYHKTTTLSSSDANQDETAWCSSFVNWCIEQSGYEGTNSAAARSWEDWGIELDTPRKGCIVVFQRPEGGTGAGHVGFFIEDAGNKIRVLGGNQDNKVKINGEDKRNFLSYRWPENYEG